VRWTIRRRLTLLNTLALAVLLAAFAALIYLLQARAIIERVDEKMEESWRQLQRDPRLIEEPAARERWLKESWERDEVAIGVFAPDGRLLAQTAELPAGAMPEYAVNIPQEAPPPQLQFSTQVLPIVGERRQLLAVLPHNGAKSVVIFVSDLAEAHRRLAQLRAILLTVVPVMLLLAGLVAYFLAGRALAPVAALEREARAIGAESLDRRLPIANPHDELGRLTATMNDMVGRLERSFAEMKRFTADASHELRTPLAVMRAEIEVAQAKPLSPDDMQLLLSSVLEECERVTRLTDQLLTLARQDAGMLLRRQRVDVAELLGGAVERLRPLAEVKRLELKFTSTPAVVDGDPDQLRQVFVNILDNAIKHTESGSVTVTLTATEKEISVSVRDTGVGIPQEHLPHVFERFYRVDKARSRERGGTGLGLSIARGIVFAHGGRIDIASKPGEGTTCTVTLPRAPAER